MGTVTKRRQVGMPFVAGRSTWPEVATLRLYDTTAEIRLFVAGPDADLVQAVGSGALRCGWIGRAAGALLCVSLLAEGGVALPWTTIPYHARNDVHDQLGPAALWDVGQDLPVTLLLVDAATGLITAIARHVWPPAAVGAIRDTLDVQMSSGTSAAGAAAVLSALHREYGSEAAGIEVMLREHHATVWETRPV